MFYTNKSIRLHTRCLEYLELIQKANNRVEDKRSYLVRYDACKDVYHPVKLMYERKFIVNYMERMENLCSWLIIRYQDVINQLNAENQKRLKQEVERIQSLITNAVNTIDL